jgi:hypothetical protein
MSLTGLGEAKLYRVISVNMFVCVSVGLNCGKAGGIMVGFEGVEKRSVRMLNESTGGIRKWHDLLFQVVIQLIDGENPTQSAVSSKMQKQAIKMSVGTIGKKFILTEKNIQ